MSIETLKSELTAFLNSEEPGVFAVKGKWGVGKTYLIHEMIKDNKNKWQHRKYTYASLFGINSLDDLKEQIFVKMQTTDSKKGKVAKTAGKHANNILSEVGLVATNAISGAMKVGIKVWMEYEIPNSKIFIDDIERRGNDLSIRNLLGFLSQLKEEKKCQVILVFNEDELNNDDKEELEKYREKIIDHEIEFVPDVDETIKIGLESKHDVAIEVLKKLNVDNIRAVNKIGKFLEKLDSRMKDFDLEVQKYIARSATVLGWFYFTRNENSIPWQFIKELQSHRERQSEKMIHDFYKKRHGNDPDPLSESLEESLQRETFIKKLEQYDYNYTGPVEQLLIEALEQGFYNAERFKTLISDLASRIDKETASQQLYDAWQIYHSSFDDDEDSFVDALVSCFQNNSEHYDPRSLESAMDILEELERLSESRKIFDLYFSVPHEFDIGYEYRDLHNLKNGSIKTKVENIIEQNRRAKDVAEIVKEFTTGSSFNDTKILHDLTEEDWISLIKKRFNTYESQFYIRRILELAQSKNSDYEIGKKVANALKSIASDGKINELRVSKFEELLNKYAEGKLEKTND